MALAYSRSALVSVLQQSPWPLNAQLWRTISQLRISRFRQTRRGCRGGSKRHVIPSICNLSSHTSSISTGITSDGFYDHEVQDEDDYLHTGSNDSLNIQVDTCMNGSSNSDIFGSHSTMLFNRLHGFLTPPRLAIPRDTLLTDFGTEASLSGSMGVADKPIASTNFLPRQNHQYLIPLSECKTNNPLCVRNPLSLEMSTLDH